MRDGHRIIFFQWKMNIQINPRDESNYQGRSNYQAVCQRVSCHCKYTCITIINLSHQILLISLPNAKTNTVQEIKEKRKINSTRNLYKCRPAWLQHAWRILVQQMQEAAADCKKQSRGEVKEKRRMILEQNDQLDL